MSCFEDCCVFTFVFVNLSRNLQRLTSRLLGPLRTHYLSDWKHRVYRIFMFPDPSFQLRRRYAYTAHTVCEGKFPISVPLKGDLVSHSSTLSLGGPLNPKP